MEPATARITLAFGFLLWALGDAVPVQVSRPYIPQEKGKCRRTETEYYNDEIQMCCDKCPPGQRMLKSCTSDENTVCTDCEDNTHTEVWNWVKECHSCRRRCSHDLMEIQNCTKRNNRICACKPGFYCITKNQGSCPRCSRFRKCFPGFGVSKPGTSQSNVECAPCPPGTFSDTESSIDVCKPHRRCLSVAISGNETSDAICRDMVPAPTRASSPFFKPEFMTPDENLWISQPDATLATSPQPEPAPTIRMVFSNGPVVSLESILGLMIVFLLLIGLIPCITVIWRKKKFLFCIKDETKVPHSVTEKSQSFTDHGRTEQQNLLESEATSSSNSLDSMLSSGGVNEFQEGKGTERRPHQVPTSEKSKCGQGTRAGSMNSEHSHNGGTQVKVTCIVDVNVFSSDHTSQCSSQSSCTDFEASTSGCPRNEDVPFSQEESPEKDRTGSQGPPENLLPDFEEKPLPTGVPDIGMKLS